MRGREREEERVRGREERGRENGREGEQWYIHKIVIKCCYRVCRLLDQKFTASACAQYVFCTISIQKHAMRMR